MVIIFHDFKMLKKLKAFQLFSNSQEIVIIKDIDDFSQKLKN